MANLTSTGAKLYISTGAPATQTQAGYEALTWVEIGGVLSIAPYGGTVAKIETKPLATGDVEKDKGSRDNGQMSATTVVRPDDPGQIMALAASEGLTQYDEHSFKVEFITGAARYSQGLVYDFTEEVGSADQTVNGSIMIELNKRVVRVDI